MLLGVVVLAGCVPGIERRCVGDRCYLRAEAEQVDRHCRKGILTWDSGKPVNPGDGSRAQCCTKAPKTPWGRFWIWITRGEEECIVHEECHINEWKTGRNEHGRCHDFGLGRPKQTPEIP